MSDFELLLPILGAIYLCECVWLIGPNALVVATMQSARKVFSIAVSEAPSNRRSIGFTGFLPFGLAFVCEPWPIYFSPEAVYVDFPQAGSKAVHDLGFDEIRSVTAQEKTIVINQTVFAKTSTRVMAKHQADLIRRLCASKLDDRAKIIEQAIANSFDQRGIEDELNRIGQLISLRVACIVLFGLLFVVLPLAYYKLPWPTSLWWWLPCFLLSLLLVIGLFCQSHKRLYGSHGTERFWKALVMTLSPTAAMRAGPTITRELLAAFHPLAVAGVLCTDRTFLVMAMRTMRETSYPILLPRGHGEDRVNQTINWFCGCLTGRLEQYLHDTDHDVAQMLHQEPARNSDDAVAYCPRCLSQFTDIDARCAHCGDRALKVFD